MKPRMTAVESADNAERPVFEMIEVIARRYPRNAAESLACSWWILVPIPAASLSGKHLYKADLLECFFQLLLLQLLRRLV